jgi:hypothetical protein
MPRILLALLLAASLRACVAYEYEHEFWLNVDGSGSVYFTARPDLWEAFKQYPLPNDKEDAARASVQVLFERSGLTVRRTRVTHRGGRTYVFVSADFADVNRLSGTPAFPDLKIALRPEGDRLRLDGAWTPRVARALPDQEGLVAVRFHLPSKIYAHENADGGVARGNIVTWREDLSRAAAGTPLTFGATIDRRSILYTTVGLFAASILLALAVLALALYWVMRRGRRLPRAA